MYRVSIAAKCNGILQYLKVIIVYRVRGNGNCRIIIILCTTEYKCTPFIRLVLEGDTPTSIRPYFFGANLVALRKEDGGVRPIAVGCTLRRLVAKVVGRKVMEEMGTLLAPRQLGYGVKGGAEAAVHAARLYLHNLDPSRALVKLDF